MTFSDRQPDPAADEIADANTRDLPLSRLLGNFADEISVASAVCINVEEIIADSLIEGAPVSDYVRTELQNVDRLIQMLTDFRALVPILPPTRLQTPTPATCPCRGYSAISPTKFRWPRQSASTWKRSSPTV